MKIISPLSKDRKSQEYTSSSSPHFYIRLPRRADRILIIDMLSVISRSLQFIVGAFLPLQITFEVIHLSKDWPFPLLKTASYSLQQQKEKMSLQMLLLKYWALYGLVYLILPNSPFYFILKVIPFDSTLLTILEIISLSEILRQFIKFIEEQDKIIALLQNFDDASRNKFEILSNILFTTINLNNKDYIATSFLFGDYTKLLIMHTRTLLLPETNYINLVFDHIVAGVTFVKRCIQSVYTKQNNNHTSNNETFNGFKWRKQGSNRATSDTTKDTYTTTPKSEGSGLDTVNRFWSAFKNEYTKAQTAGNDQKTGFSSGTETSESSSANRNINTSDDYEIIDNELD